MRIKKYERVPWTQEERYFLKKHYNVLPLEELLLGLPGRTAQSVYNQVHYLKKRRWTFNRKPNE